MGLLTGLIVLLAALWLIGFLLHIAGAFIHILLVIAIIVLIIRLFKGKKKN